MVNDSCFLRDPLWSWGFSSEASSGKEPAYQFMRLKRHRLDPCVGKIPWRSAQQPTPISLPGESHGQRHLTRLKWLNTAQKCNLTEPYRPYEAMPGQTPPPHPMLQLLSKVHWWASLTAQTVKNPPATQRM